MLTNGAGFCSWNDWVRGRGRPFSAKGRIGTCGENDARDFADYKHMREQIERVQRYIRSPKSRL